VRVKEQIEGDRRDRQQHESGGMIRKTGGGR
jgi:hypothetical protein